MAYFQQWFTKTSLKHFGAEMSDQVPYIYLDVIIYPASNRNANLVYAQNGCHFEMDVIQRTWYGFSYLVQADLRIERCESVDRIILFEIHDFLNTYLNLMIMGILTTENIIFRNSQQKEGFIATFRLIIHSHKRRWAARIADGVSCEYAGSLSMEPADFIWIEFVGEI